MSVAGRTAFITGAGSGIGKALANKLLSEGAHTIVAVDHSSKTLFLAVDQFTSNFPKATIISIVADVTKPDNLSAAFETAKKSNSPPISIVVNNAGTAIEHGNLWRNNVELNLVAPILSSQMGLSVFKENPETGGVIVNVASMAGLAPMPFGPVYTATKHGLVGFSRCFDHLARKNIRVTALCPAFVDTPMVRNMLENSPPKEAAMGQAAIDSLGGLIPMENVERAFMDLVTNDEHVGSIMRITNANGAEVHKYPDADAMKLPSR